MYDDDKALLQHWPHPPSRPERVAINAESGGVTCIVVGASHIASRRKLSLAMNGGEDEMNHVVPI